MTTLSAELFVRSALLSSLPDLEHGFTTRSLGSMAGQVRPAAEHARNRAVLESLIGMPLVKASQVHSADVVLVERGVATRLRDGASERISNAMRLEADALITRDRGVALAVAVADCVPVLVAYDEWIGIAHAGWEGVTKGVVGAMVEAIRREGARGEARAAIGPSIGPCCYDIDASRARIVRDRLGRAAGAALTRRADGRFAFDLWRAVRAQLGGCAVDALGRCTKDEVTRFFSHRGENGKAGRGLAFIGWAILPNSKDEREARDSEPGS